MPIGAKVLASLPRTMPSNMPPATSVAWWMRTWILLQATTVPRIQNGQRRFVASPRRVAAKNALQAWPLGKLEVRGMRRLWGRSSVESGGRTRRKNDLIMRFTKTDSKARAAAVRKKLRLWRPPRKLSKAASRCQSRLQSPRLDAV